MTESIKTHADQMKRRNYLVFLLPFILLLIGCSSAAKVESLATPAPQMELEKDKDETDCELPKPLRDADWKRDAWESINTEGKYCLAQPDDFHIPESAAWDKWSKIGIEAFKKHPFAKGDLNRDLKSGDVAMFIVDKTIPTPERFSIMIIHEPSDKETISTVRWLYKNEDLSRAMFGGGSGIFGLRKYQGDGKFTFDYINWDDKKQDYSIDKKYKWKKY